MAVVRTALSETFGVPAGRIAAYDLLLDLPDADSQHLLCAVTLIELRLGVRLGEREATDIRTVGELAQMVYEAQQP
ncbi:hypothetical protein ACIBF1_33340 [Spirillospora sp. NPDC050679]